MTLLLPRQAIIPGYELDPSLVLYLPLHEIDGSSFQSKDHYGHLAAATGTLWTPRGRSFDGIDDKIVIPRHSALEPAQITLSIWAKILSGSTEANGVLIEKPKTDFTDPYYSYTLYASDTNTATPDFNAAFPVGAWGAGDLVTLTDISAVVNHWALYSAIFDGTNMVLDINAGYRTASVANPGALTYYATDLYIGMARNLAVFDLYAEIGTVWINSRALSPLELQHRYINSRWRYK